MRHKSVSLGRPCEVLEITPLNPLISKCQIKVCYVKIENGNKSRTSPYASVGFGRVSLSAAACELLGDYSQYKYAEFLKARENGKLCFGI